MAQITWSHISVVQLQHPRKSLDLDSFSDFLEKLEAYFGTIIWYYLQQVQVTFSSFFQGTHKLFSLETTQKDKKY